MQTGRIGREDYGTVTGMKRKQHLMYEIYGKADAKCRDCMHLYGDKGDYRKCLLYGKSASEATDWALSWQACGMFNQPVKDDFVTIIQRKKRGFYSSQAPETQCDGQLSLFD